MYKLEVITRRPSGGPARAVPLMFIHGAFCGAAIWDVHFLPYFAALGYEVHAVSLRGHGGSEGRARLPWFSLSDYVADLVQVIQTCRAMPVLIGHSMGGMVVQRYLRTERARGAVLMASVPPYGLWDSTIGMAFRDPMLVHQLGLLMTFGPGLVSTSCIRRAMFSERVSAEDAVQFEHLLQSESQRVVIDMLAFDPFAQRPDPRLPILVLGGERDAFIPAAQAETTALTLGTEAIIFPHMAHAMMLEPDWRLVADHIDGWIQRMVPE